MHYSDQKVEEDFIVELFKGELPELKVLKNLKGGPNKTLKTPNQ